MISKDDLKNKYKMLSMFLDERSLRLCAATDAKCIGYGGVSQVAGASGFSRTTIHAGIHELESGCLPDMENTASERRIRRPGGGRKQLKETDKTLLENLERLLDPVTRGDPMSPLRWTCKSTTNLSGELQAVGHQVSQPTVWRLLDELGYSMQSNRKTIEGTEHPDRNAQFEYISGSVNRFLSRGLPVISVDTKKKELIGQFKNNGKDWRKKGEPVKVNVHDFADKDLGKAIPYGVYDIGRNEGWVSVGVTNDTAEFAVETIRRWWKTMGRDVYPKAKDLLITADCGGSNGARVKLWKFELQRFANEFATTIHVRHFPPGTSKWNKIEHRMFCHITQNWRGRPLTSRMAVVNLIAATKTAHGLSISAGLDEEIYEKGRKVTKKQIEALSITCCEFHGEWNYKITPCPQD